MTWADKITKAIEGKKGWTSRAEIKKAISEYDDSKKHRMYLSKALAKFEKKGDSYKVKKSKKKDNSKAKARKAAAKARVAARKAASKAKKAAKRAAVAARKKAAKE